MTESLFDLLAAEQARDEALARVHDHANEEWKTTALQAICDLALKQTELTTDDVWLALSKHDCATHEPRALGSVMRQAAVLGIIKRTDTTRRSIRTARHRGDVRVWRCLL